MICSARPQQAPRAQRNHALRPARPARSPAADGARSKRARRRLRSGRRPSACRVRRRAQERTSDGYANAKMAGLRAPRGDRRPGHAPPLAARRGPIRLLGNGDARLGRAAGAPWAERQRRSLRAVPGARARPARRPLAGERALADGRAAHLRRGRRQVPPAKRGRHRRRLVQRPRRVLAARVRGGRRRGRPGGERRPQSDAPGPRRSRPRRVDGIHARARSSALRGGRHGSRARRRRRRRAWHVRPRRRGARGEPRRGVLRGVGRRSQGVLAHHVRAARRAAVPDAVRRGRRRRLGAQGPPLRARAPEGGRARRRLLRRPQARRAQHLALGRRGKRRR